MMTISLDGLEKCFPELISHVGNEKFVHYEGLIPLIVEAIKIQEKQLSDLKRTVNQDSTLRVKANRNEANGLSMESKDKLTHRST
jgi:hypothetical protein